MIKSKNAVLLALSVSLLAVSGCASGPNETRADGGAPVCTRSYPMGSNIPTTTCVSADAAAEAKRLEDANPMRAPIALPRAGGG